MNTHIRLHPNGNLDSAQVYVDGSLVATIPMYQIENMIETKRRIQAKRKEPYILAPGESIQA